MGIMKGISDFLVILAVCIVGFSFTFYVLYHTGPGVYSSAGVGGGDVVDGPYGMDAWQNSLFAGFLMSILGDFNVKELYASSNYVLALVLFLVFMIFVNIVMLNLLIAIMGEIFDVQENA